MSIAGIASTALFSLLNGTQSSTAQSGQNNFQTEFQQLGQDLQSGNLTQAQQDYATLSQNFQNASQTSASNSGNPIAQAFNALSQNLQSGNLSAAQQDYATIQQDFQQGGSSQVHGHHHHHGGGGQNSRQDSQIQSAFSSLAQELQAGSLSGAQTAFATLESDLSQLNPYSGSSAAAGESAVQATGSTLSVSA
jgi:hypothetical protein